MIDTGLEPVAKVLEMLVRRSTSKDAVREGTLRRAQEIPTIVKRVCGIIG
jgi:hypothetical protein